MFCMLQGVYYNIFEQKQTRFSFDTWDITPMTTFFWYFIHRLLRDKILFKKLK